MTHYLTDFEFTGVGDWNLQPSDLKVTTGREEKRGISMPKIASYWRHAETGDVVVACDWGIGGRYQLYHISEQYIEQGSEWLKALRLQKDNATYSHGARVLEEERYDAEEFIKKIEEYLQSHSDGVLRE